MSSKKTGIEGAIAPLPTADAAWWKEEMTPTSTGQTEWIRIAVVNYHTALDHELPSEISCVPLWVHWPVVAAFEDTLKEEEKKRHMIPGTAGHVLRLAYQAALQGYDVQPRENPVGGEDGGGGMSVYIVQGPTRTVRKYAHQFLDMVADDAKDVGGDDDYFDYYPDRVYCALQLAIPLGLEDEYKEAYDEIMKHYKDLEPDVIPTWAETVPKEVV